MPKDHTTDHYEIEVNLRIVERNAYGDQMSQGGLHYCKTVKASSLLQLGTMLGKIEEVIKES